VKLDDEQYRRLVVFNSVVAMLVLIVGVGFVSARRERIAGALTALVEVERAESHFLRQIGVAPPDGASTEKPLPAYQIKIDPEHYREIQVLTAKLVQQKALLEEDKRWFPARVVYEDREYRAKIRLRGDGREHWSTPKKSWRVRFKGDVWPEGRRTLDFIIPGDKGYEVETVAYAMARDLGLLVPDAGFARVALNGVDTGVYFWMEKYGKEMLERQGRPEGEIFREANTWIQTRFTGYGIYRSEGTGLRARDGNFDATIGTEPGVRHATRRWHEFLTLLRESDDATFDARIEELLDVEKYLHWNALTWLFGSVHSHWGDNLRWHYDDTTGLLEPILYDVYRFPIENQASGTFEIAERDPLARRLLAAGRHQRRRNEILWRLLEDERFDAARLAREQFARLRPALVAGVGGAAPAAVDGFHAETLRILDENRAKLRGHLAFARAFAAPRIETRDALEIEIVPDSMAPIRLVAVTLEGGTNAHRPRATLVAPDGSTRAVALEARTGDGRLRLALRETTLHTPRDARLVPQVGAYRLRIEGLADPDSIASIQLELSNAITHASIDGAHLYQAPIAARPTPLAPVDLPLRDTGEALVLAAGAYTIASDAALPVGRTLRLDPGVTLEMAPGASLLVRGPLIAEGTQAAPIVVRASDPSDPFGAIGVIRAGAPSRLAHFRISGGSDDRVAGIFLSGQLAFHASPVGLRDCEISGARGDDALNVKTTRVSVERCRFEGNASDGFDGDWIEGEVSHSTFERNGGDGLDLSGSIVTVSDTLFDRMGDKAISAGERTRLVAFNVVLRDSATGLAIKDLSQVRVASSVLFGNRTAIAAYRKKPIFGGGSGEIVSSLLWRNGRDVELDDESTLRLDAVALERWEPVAGAVADDVRTGDVAAAYRARGVSGFSLVDAHTAFATGANPSEPLPAPLAAPDLASVPIGLARPLTSAR
jgi:hypothetical protein